MTDALTKYTKLNIFNSFEVGKKQMHKINTYKKKTIGIEWNFPSQVSGTIEVGRYIKIISIIISKYNNKKYVNDQSHN